MSEHAVGGRLTASPVPSAGSGGNVWTVGTRALTAGLSCAFYRQQAAILEDLVKNVPLEFDFLFSASQAEVISGKQEGNKNT